MCAMRGNERGGGARRRPYQKLQSANRDWVAYINISKLEPNKAYKLLGMVTTNHDVYGAGQQATITSKNGPKYRTQLPGKYLAKMSDEDIDTLKADILIGRNPYLIYREQLPDNSYRLDLVEKDDKYDQLFDTAAVVPEIQPNPKLEAEAAALLAAANGANNVANNPPGA